MTPKKLFLLAVFVCAGYSSARAWDWSKPFIYEFRIALETDNWTNHYSTTTVLSKSDNTVAFRVVANSTTTDAVYQLVVTTQGNVGIATASPEGLFTIGNGTLTVLSNGNVGIGTTKPERKLDVNGTIKAFSGESFGTIAVKSTASGGNEWDLNSFATTGDFRISQYGVADFVTILPTNGNVGIGTTGAAEKLEVSGSVKLSGDIYNSAWTDYSASSTIVGWSSFTMKKIYVKKIGRTVFVSFAIDGTSSGDNTYFSLPYSAASFGTSQSARISAIDNYAESPNAQATLFDGAKELWFHTGLQGQQFTSSGRKAASGQMWYEAAN